MRLVQPIDYLISEKPVIFLAGPIQGAPDWHKEALGYFAHDDVTVASPKCVALRHSYEEQVNWESYYLDAASRQGAILFWLAKEATHHPERAYAQTTRFELAEWLFKDDTSVVLGIEPGFSGERYIRHRLKSYNTPIYTTLLLTCLAARATALGDKELCTTCQKPINCSPTYCSNPFHAMGGLHNKGFRNEG